MKQLETYAITQKLSQCIFPDKEVSADPRIEHRILLMEEPPWRFSGPLEWQRDILKGSHHLVSIFVPEALWFWRQSPWCCYLLSTLPLYTGRGSDWRQVTGAVQESWKLGVPRVMAPSSLMGCVHSDGAIQSTPQRIQTASAQVCTLSITVSSQSSSVSPLENGKITMTLSLIRLFWEKNKRLFVIFEVKAHYIIVIITSFQEIRTDSQHMYFPNKNNRSLIQQNSLVITVHHDSCCMHSWVMNGFSFKETGKNFLRGRQENKPKDFNSLLYYIQMETITFRETHVIGPEFTCHLLLWQSHHRCGIVGALRVAEHHFRLFLSTQSRSKARCGFLIITHWTQVSNFS